MTLRDKFGGIFQAIRRNEASWLENYIRPITDEFEREEFVSIDNLSIPSIILYTSYANADLSYDLNNPKWKAYWDNPDTERFPGGFKPYQERVAGFRSELIQGQHLLKKLKDYARK